MAWPQRSWWIFPLQLKLSGNILTDAPDVCFHAGSKSGQTDMKTDHHTRDVCSTPSDQTQLQEERVNTDRRLPRVDRPGESATLDNDCL